ncbi:MAG: hypothetical protein QW632_04445 [Ignisphaera sp.]
MSEALAGVSAVLKLMKDARDDIKKLIDLLTELNSHMSKLESFTGSLEKLINELDEANKNFKTLIEILNILKELSK